MSQTWVQCLESLKNTLPLGEFSVWVKPLKAAERNETLYLYAPSASLLNISTITKILRLQLF